MMGGGYSLQSQSTTFYSLSLFSGAYLMPNGLTPGDLLVTFNAPLTAIQFDFATADFHQNEVPTTIQLDAFLGPDWVRVAAVAKCHGTTHAYTRLLLCSGSGPAH